MPPAADPRFADAACGLLVAAPDGTIASANHTFCRWLGYTPDELEGRVRFQDLLTIGGRIYHQTHWLPLMRLQGAVAEVKLDFTHRDGHRLPMVLNAHVVTGPEGEPVHALAAFVASDRDRYEQELLRAREHSEALLRRQTAMQEEATDRGVFAEQLIGIVSHDLRTPLHAIRAGTERLASNELDPKRLHVASLIQRAVDRAVTLIDDLLDFTLTRTGRALSIQRTPVHLHAVVATGLEELRWAFPTLVLEHVAEGPDAVEADAGRMKQVVGNLVANAARYGDPTRPVTVTTAVHEGMASITVHNYGSPIDPALLPTLFQAMTRGADAVAGGVGLGLYIVSEIAKGHGGTVTASSNSAEGTSVRMGFPTASCSSATR